MKKIRELMQTRLVTVHPDDPWSLAARLMLWAHVRHLPVVSDGRLVSVVTERDVVELRGRGQLSGSIASRMPRRSQSAHPDEDLVEVAARMADSKIDCLPIVETGRLVGLITTTDVLRHIVGEALHGQASRGREVREVMTARPATTAMDDLLLDAAGRMRNLGIRHLPVVDGNGKVIGILSDRDVRTAIGDLLARGDEQSMQMRVQLDRVSDVARLRPITVRENTTLTQAIHLLAEHRVGALPVVDERDRLVGIVSYLDVLEAEEPAARGRATPEGQSPTLH